MGKHTDLPWKVTTRHYVDHIVRPGLAQEVAYCGDCEYGDREANAQLIVTAVNNHARLVEALRDLCKPELGAGALTRARTILAQLDGETE